MSKIIVVANQKGGVAKTSTVRNLSYSLAELGKKVLTVDLDPQRSLTISFGILPKQAKHTTGTLITRMLTEEELPERNEYIHTVGKVDVIPASRAYACIGQDIMPTEERGSIGQVKPSGWHTVKYDIVDGNYLYNRCHLIGYQLSAENANTANLITGTRYMNVQGMLPFENMVADYVKETNNHVLYRVTPIFYGTNLVANGVQMEAKSVEDDGDGICFNVFVYNVQPGITIDYSTGTSWLSNTTAESKPSSSPEISITYIYNKNTKKFHRVGCYSVDKMKESNKGYFEGSRSDMIQRGYSPCKNCNP